MADIQHAVITDPYLHEPKGIAGASANTVYVANGAGTGTWQTLTTDDIDMQGISDFVESEITSGGIAVNGTRWITVIIRNLSQPETILIPFPTGATVVSARAVLGGAITGSNAVINFNNGSGAAMGAPLTIVPAGSAKGVGATFTATGNNVIAGNSYMEIASTGASTGSQSLYITVRLSSPLNP